MEKSSKSKTFKKQKVKLSEEQDLEILIDRNVVKHDDEDTQFRFSDSVQTSFFEGGR